MKTTLEDLKNRRSCRTYRPEQITEEELEQVLQAGKVNHFHACANNRGAPGQGVIPWEDLLGLLVRYGYGGHITMETFALGGLDSSWVQVHSEPDELAREGLFYLQAFFKTKAGL